MLICTEACKYWPILLDDTSSQIDQYITLRFFKNTKYFLILIESLLLFILATIRGHLIKSRPKKRCSETLFMLPLECKWHSRSRLQKDFHYLKHIMLFTITIWYVFQKHIFTNDKKDISIKGYNAVRVDHPSNAKRGEVYLLQRITRCAYYIYSKSNSLFFIKLQ